ncbi:MAG: DUF4129 domain-containing protein, partial [Nitrososphaerota archaeon]|nr:DUF4129 domain-containing protein [Nitrososphaerota archaeon]
VGLLATIVVALPWLTVSVAANLQAYPPPVPTRIGNWCAGASCPTSVTSLSPITGQANPALFQLALLAVAAIFLGVSYYAWRKGVRSGQDSLWNLPALLVAFGLFYVFLIASSFLQGYSFPGSGVIWASSFPLSYLSTSLVVIAGGISAMWILSRSGRTRTLRAPPAAERSIQTTVAVLQKAIDSLRRGGAPRLVIINCYRSMEELLQEGGVINAPSMTVREFETASREAFSIESGPIHRLTTLFERARYSEEEIDAPQAADAEAVLSELREGMGKVLMAK